MVVQSTGLEANPMAVRFIPVDRATPSFLPPSIEELLPRDHLARFVVDIVERLDLSRIEASYSGRGSAAYHPSMLVSLLFYGYATGTFTSRRLEQATYDSIAFRFITANQQPDHDTIANFRRRFLVELGSLFTQVLVVAAEMGLLKLGSVSLDGTKIKANASRHTALSYEYANRLEKQLKREVDELMRRAEEADVRDEAQHLDIPEELLIREQRLKEIAKAKARIEQRAQQRYDRESAEYDNKLAARKKKEQDTGRKLGGFEPKPPQAGVRAKDQINLSDDESAIMRVTGGGFDQAYNAQASVELESMLIVGRHVSASSSDRHQLVPALEELAKLPTELGSTDTIIADNGYYSKANAETAERLGVSPLLAMGRERYDALKREGPGPELSDDATAFDRMKQRLKSREGRSLYARRKCTVEPVFGIIKHVMGLRQFNLRGLNNVQGEWTLVSIAWNLKRMAKLSAVATA